MRISTVALMAGLLAASCGVAQAALPNGNEVSVTPVTGGGTLYYPGGQYMRVIQSLRQPGQTSRDNGAIELRMPGTRAARTAAPAARTASVAPRTPTTQPAPPRRTAAAAPPAPAPAPSNGSGYNPNYGALGAPQGSAAGLSIEAAPTPPPRQVAKAEPPPAVTRPLMTQEPPTPGLTKRSVILFSAGASDPAKKALDSIKFLAGDLNAAMVSSGSRIQLLAYGGDKGDKGSDARRLSLKRALSIRQVLIDDGVPSERIDVRAMGGADDGGPADRVDVFVKT